MLEVLCRSDEPLTVADVCRLAKCTTVPIQALRKQGLVHTVRRRLPVGLPSTDAPGDPPAGTQTVAGSPAAASRTAPAAGHGRRLTAEQAVDARAARAGDRVGRLRPVLDPRRDRQRQDRGVPGGDRSRWWRAAARRSCWCPRSA